MAKAKLGHHRPHKRVTYCNQVLDLKTGELVEVPSMTKQSFVPECDINNIVKQYSATGVFKHVSARAEQGMYVDLPDELDFQTSIDIVRAAETAFSSLPSSVRSRFENDPGQFLEFMSNPKNQEEMIKLGLATDLRPPKAPEAPPTAPTGGEGGSPPSGGAKAP